MSQSFGLLRCSRPSLEYVCCQDFRILTATRLLPSSFQHQWSIVSFILRFRLDIQCYFGIVG